MFSLFNGDIQGAGRGATNQVFQVSLPLAAETPTLQLQQFQAEKGFNWWPRNHGGNEDIFKAPYRRTWKKIKEPNDVYFMWLILAKNWQSGENMRKQRIDTWRQAWKQLWVMMYVDVWWTFPGDHPQPLVRSWAFVRGPISRQTCGSTGTSL